MSVVNVKVKYIRPDYDNLEEWMEDPNNIYIGRGRVVFIDGERYPKKDSQWANPFKIGKDGDRDEVIAKYKKYVMESPTLQKRLHKLRGKQLGCWCKPDACHGDILLELVNSLDK